MELSDCSVSLSSLFCDEDGSRLDAGHEEEEVDELFIVWSGPILSQAVDDEYIETLVSKETSFATASISFSDSGEGISMIGDSLRRSRFESIRWILKMKSCFGFGWQTAYLAVNYFDRFFLRRTIDEAKTWAMELLSIACLSLAAKMEENRPPALSAYRMGEFQFSSKLIQRMEFLLLDTLEWRLSSVTPFAYLTYFVSKFQFQQSSKDLISRAIWFIFLIAEGARFILFFFNSDDPKCRFDDRQFDPNAAINVMDNRPSTVAAASIFAASGEGLTKKLMESKLSAVFLSEPMETELVFSCYNAMILESQKEKLRSPNALLSLTSSDDCSTNNKKRRLQ
ncbi:Cyclin-D5-1 [Apostasia shenzhenica]|uniref:Cyclin-D5-1 n=1 Tax=Apostasia shenzhenica TaxID=1088818 RepID=A0A2I0A2P3_9ASPA|nr:Cyclin-D5-1 [Apostasia shenzhenica]